MTNQEAIHELKTMLNKCRGDFYPTRRKALTMAINALYEQEEDDEYMDRDREAHTRSRYKRITKRYEDSEV